MSASRTELCLGCPKPARKMSPFPKSSTVHVQNEKSPSGVYVAAYRRWIKGVRARLWWMSVTSERTGCTLTKMHFTARDEKCS